MRFAIIAAGEGSRLAQEGIDCPKPLVRLCGEALIDRLIRIFDTNGAHEIVIIVNALHPETEAHVRTLIQERPDGVAPIRLVVQTTPSSMHSLAVISPHLQGEPFCLTTVDTVFREDEFARYIRAFKDSHADGMMAVTDFIDDEKPLYVGTDDLFHITGFHDEPSGYRYISGGIYCLQPIALLTLQRCMDEGQSRMRNFQRALVDDGLHLIARPFGRIVDVDHASDIPLAESFLRELTF